MYIQVKRNGSEFLVDAISDKLEMELREGDVLIKSFSSSITLFYVCNQSIFQRSEVLKAGIFLGFGFDQSPQ